MTRREPAWVPPMRNGVSASRVGVHSSQFDHVLAFLTERFPAVGDWPERLARGDVLDETGQPVAAHAPCTVGSLLWYWRQPPPEPRVPFEVELLYQDEHLVVVDKPHFLSVAPSGRHLQETVLVRLKHRLGLATLAPMHRLDRETAGVMVFTVQPHTRHAYQSLLRDKHVRKVYEAIAPWREGLSLPRVCSHRLEKPGPDAYMQMQVVAGEPNAHTHVELVKHLPDGGQNGVLAHYRLTPLTGRTHQLRAQMCALGLPIVGDRIYPRLWPEMPLDASPNFNNPLQLLARQIEFVDPISGQLRSFSSRRRLELATDDDTCQVPG